MSCKTLLTVSSSCALDSIFPDCLAFTTQMPFRTAAFVVTMDSGFRCGTDSAFASHQPSANTTELFGCWHIFFPSFCFCRGLPVLSYALLYTIKQISAHNRGNFMKRYHIAIFIFANIFPVLQKADTTYFERLRRGQWVNGKSPVSSHNITKRRIATVVFAF